MASSSSSPFPPPQRKYNVFFSFSGCDSRKNIVSHLEAALERNGFHTFRDDENLGRGKDIAGGLWEAIENSSMSLVVFSKNYFASTWCLRELEKIMECKEKSQHIILPIFVDVEPSDIRKFKGSIAETLAKHEEVPKMEYWRPILREAANMSGYVSNQYRDEASLVDAVVEEVQGKLSPHILLNVATHPVGIEPRLQELLKELCLESSDDVRIIAIWGVGGVGKTTIAKAAYNSIRSRFEGCSFVENVRETWKQSRVVDLQNHIRSDILKKKNCEIRNSPEGVEFLKHIVFYGRKVLLVLDDVDNEKQLEALAIDRESRFHRGSRIIVTTRDISSLNSLQSVECTGHQSGVKLVLTIYELEQLNMNESLRLFSLRAFNQHNPPKGFMKFSNEVVGYAGGIPLVLEVLGCYLNGKNDQSVWRSAITKLKKIPNKDVQAKLRISFDSLDIEQQKLFLDIACSYVGESKYLIIHVLQDSEIFPEDGFQRLEDICLLKCDQRGGIVMHDVLKQMGREIVRQENVDYPGKRSRIWDENDARKVLKNCEGTEAVEVFILMSDGKAIIKVKAKAFQNMTRLRVLHLDHVQLSPGHKLLFRNNGYKHLSKNLVWLCWHHFDLSDLPSQLYLENLVALDLSFSNIKRVWRGTKVLNNLKFLDLKCCRNLITTPNFSGLPNLEELNLSNCERLQEVDKSIAHLDKLRALNISNCTSLRKLLSEMTIKQDRRVLSALIFLDINGCHNLATTPNFSWIPNLEELNLMDCEKLQEVDKSIGHLDKLRVLKIKNCASLRKLLPETAIKQDRRVTKVLSALIFLDINGCHNFTTTPNFSWIPNLEVLYLMDCEKLQEVDKSIEHLDKLRVLEIGNCGLRKLPDVIGSMSSLTNLGISKNKFSSLPESIWNLTKLQTLGIEDCGMSNLPSELGRLNQLQYLYLRGNNFCSLPESIGDLTKLQVLNLVDCERLQWLPKLSDGLALCRFVDVSNCPSLRRISLESIMNYGDMFCFNCPKLDEKYCADKIGTSFLNYKGACSFNIYHSGGMFPDWLQHETTNLCYALKVPPLEVGNNNFIRCIFYVIFNVECSSRPYPFRTDYKLLNKTKDVHKYVYQPSYFYSDNGFFIGDQISLSYSSFHVDKLDLKEGDELEISWYCENLVLKKWGIHVSYYSTDDIISGSSSYDPMESNASDESEVDESDPRAH